jgi:ADP-ribose pyrophosphatase
MTFTKDDYEISNREVLYQRKFRYSLITFKHRTFRGAWTKSLHYELLERPPAVAVLPYDPILNNIVFIEQFRIGAMASETTPWLLEVVAGIHDANEDNESLAIRETKEEAGLEVLDLHLLCDYFVSPGASNEHLHLYIGRVSSERAGGLHGVLQEDEDIQVHVMSLPDAIKKLTQGEFKNAPTIIALQWLQLHQEWLKNLWQTK